MSNYTEEFEAWYAKSDARFWNNWDACLSAFVAGQKSATLRQQAGRVDEEAVKRALHTYRSTGWGSGKGDCETAMRNVLTEFAALAQNAQGEIGVGVDVTDEGTHVCVRQGKTIVYSRMHHAERARVPEWTDAQCWEFMSMALRHVEYAEGSRGPTCEEIRQGVRHATASATPSQPEDAGEVES